MEAKARRYVRLGKVIKVGFNSWEVLPLENAKTTHRVELHDGRGGRYFTCDCQRNKWYGKTCSHILAVINYEKMKKEEKV